MAGIFASLIGKRLKQTRPAGLLRDERGATAVEFGLLAVPFFMLIGATLETTVLFLSEQILDSSVQDASRLIRTGESVARGIVDVASFKAEVCSGLFGLFTDCSKLHVEVKVVYPFGSTTITPPINFSTCDRTSCSWTRPEVFDLGKGNDIVTIQVYYKWPVFTGLGGYNLGNLNDGTRLMSGSTVLRNEPFS